MQKNCLKVHWNVQKRSETDETWHSIEVFCFFRLLNIKKILVSGGSLSHRVAPQILNDGGGEKVDILVLDEAGRVSVFIIRENNASTLKY